MEIICVPIITAAVYGVIELLKTATKSNEKFLNFVPLVGLILGALLGVAFYYLLPNLISASSVFTAILVGGASGLSATGCNQIFKQLKKYGVTVKEAVPSEIVEKECENVEQSSNVENTTDKNVENAGEFVENGDKNVEKTDESVEQNTNVE